MNFKKMFVTALAATHFFSLPVLVSADPRNGRPFWTEQSSFVESNTLFTVGVASNAVTVEHGRVAAFEAGKREIMNFAQLADLDEAGIVIATQMTYEEPNADGTFNVFRLLKTDARKVVDAQRKVSGASKKRLDELDKLIRDNKALEDSLRAKKAELESYAQQGSDAVAAIDRAQAELTGKMKRLDAVFSKVDADIAARQKMIDQMKDSQSRLNVQNAQADELLALALKRIKDRTEMAKKYVCRGMTIKEVEAILGEPDSGSYYGLAGINWGPDGIADGVTIEVKPSVFHRYDNGKLIKVNDLRTKW